jgi:endo-1,4-beta-mannosidase
VPTPTLTPAPTPAPTGNTAFVARCGTTLCLNGQTYRFKGLNIYNANSVNNCWYTLGTGSSLDSSLTAIGSGQNVFRAWFFQRFAIVNGVRDWSVMDHTFAVAAARGERVVVTLDGQWGDCDASGYKSESWYQSGYKTATDYLNLTTYRQWVSEIVTRYRDNPTILAWQMMNEAEDLTAAGGSCSSTAEASMHAWAADISGLIKSIDSNHLVNLGTIGNGQCGTSTGTSYQDLHAISTIDLCEYHDYGHASSPMPGDQWNGLATRLSQCQADGKAMFVGEIGIDTTDPNRSSEFDAKITAQFSAGVVGFLPWEWRAAGQTGGDQYVIGPNDPVLGVLAAH